jgi:branched-chain amino acid transport system substrate-binding protein
MIISYTSRAACLAALAAAALAACGAGRKSTSSTTASAGEKVLDVYSDLPLLGALASTTVPIENGMKLALAQAGYRAGQFTIHYIPLNDATEAKAGYDVNQCAADARVAATDPRAIAFLGAFNSGCSEVEIPILNQAGIPMVSPANTYVGLTTNEPGSAPGEPQKYYPTGVRTYLRIVPRDSIQAAADLLAFKQAGCKRVAEANDKTPYGAGIAELIELERKYYGVEIVSDTGVDPTAPSYRSYAAMIRAQGADCFFYGGLASTGGVRITEDVHAAIPTAKLFGSGGMCSSRWTNPKMGGVPSTLWPLMRCTVAPLALSAYPGGSAFQAAYKARYGVSNPGPYAIFGYEAMRLVLDTIASLGPQGDSRSALLRALFAIRDRHSVLGTYSFDKDGDTTVTSYGLYKVGPDGDPKFYKVLTPAHVL